MIFRYFQFTKNGENMKNGKHLRYNRGANCDKLRCDK